MIVDLLASQLEPKWSISVNESTPSYEYTLHFGYAQGYISMSKEELMDLGEKIATALDYRLL